MQQAQKETPDPDLIFAYTEADLESLYDRQRGDGNYRKLDAAQRRSLQHAVQQAGAETMFERFREVVENLLEPPPLNGP